jgi:outer membrane protein OmpA-like peptidoglycan-associated protein
MNLKALLVLLAAILFMLGAQWWYSTEKAPNYCCGKEKVAPPSDTSGEGAATIGTAAALGPLLFNWTNATPVTSDKFAAYKKGIMNGDEKENILVITGKYYEGEKAPKGYENMGLARAAEIRKLFPGVPDTRIELVSELVAKPNNLDTSLAFSSANINWKAAPVEEKTVIELANKALIYFPYRQSNKEVDSKVDEYLRKLAERLKSGNEKVIVTGHTDDRGEADTNMKLGERRAKNVRDILRKLGVPANRITTVSKGETEPAEANGTERGWRLNRRTVVEVVQ